MDEDVFWDEGPAGDADNGTMAILLLAKLIAGGAVLRDGDVLTVDADGAVIDLDRDEQYLIRHIEDGVAAS